MSRGECPNCELVFASDESFDKHRVGQFCDHRPEEHTPRCRRCLTVEEMLAGLPEINEKKTPWRKNNWGGWTHRPPVVREPVAGSHSPSQAELEPSEGQSLEEAV